VKSNNIITSICISLTILGCLVFYIDSVDKKHTADIEKLEIKVYELTAIKNKVDDNIDRGLEAIKNIVK
jgi:hypothetical protein